MYKEDEKKIGWLKILVRVIIVFLVFMLSIKLISVGISRFKGKEDNDYLKDNLKIMDKAASEYFVEENLPTKLGKSSKVSLKFLIDKKYLEELKDDKGNTCSLEESFIQATRLDTEYQIKSFIECGSDSDFSTSFIKIEDKPNQTIKTTTKDATKKTTTTKKVVTTKKTTKKVTTTRKTNKTTSVRTTTSVKTTNNLYYHVDFNTNGGNYIATQYFTSGSRMVKITPTRKGYKFLGWYYNGKEFDFNTRIYRDYVLVAKWVEE